MVVLTEEQQKELNRAVDYFKGFRMAELKLDDKWNLNIIFKYLPKKATFRETTPIEKSVLPFLNGVREEGKINMFSSPSLISQVFGVDRKESIKLFDLWTINFNDECNYNIVKTEKDVDKEI